MTIRYMTWCGSVVALLVMGIQFVDSAAPESAPKSASGIQAGGVLTPDVAGVFQRACGDCHSNGTKWPWYSQVPPGSWLMLRHVREGRRNLNFSEWSPQHKVSRNQVEEICDAVEKGDMPPTSYTLLHRDARLSAADVHTICDWSERVQRGGAGSTTLSELIPGRDGERPGSDR